MRICTYTNGQLADQQDFRSLCASEKTPGSQARIALSKPELDNVTAIDLPGLRVYAISRRMSLLQSCQQSLQKLSRDQSVDGTTFPNPEHWSKI